MTSTQRMVAGWVLEERLGSGGFAEVWKARRRHAGSARALKLLRIASQDAFDSWRHEIGRLEELSHPNVVRFYDADVITEPPYDDHAWIATELCTRSLADELQHRDGHVLREPECGQLLREMLAALAAAHARGCVHRDVKPANILWHDSGVWKLCDFGTARLVPTGAAYPHTRVVGTSPYMSAAAHSGRQDHGADLYALGVTLHEALCGERLHRRPEGASDTQYAMTILKTAPRVSDALPGNWARVVEVLIGRHGSHTATELAIWFQETRGARLPRSGNTATRVVVPAPGDLGSRRGDTRPDQSRPGQPGGEHAADKAAAWGGAAADAAARAPKEGEGADAAAPAAPATAMTDRYQPTQATVVQRSASPEHPRTLVYPGAPPGSAQPDAAQQAAPQQARPASPSPGHQGHQAGAWAGYTPPGAAGPYPYQPRAVSVAGNGVLWPVPAVTGRRLLATILDAVLVLFLTSIFLQGSAEYARVDAGGLVEAREACEEYDAAGVASCLPVGSDVYVASETPWRTWLTPLIVWLLVDVVLQGLTGVTPGKLLFGLRTVTATGQGPGLLRALGRWVFWLLDALPICVPLFGLIAVSSSRGQRRIGDRAAGTFVVPRGIVQAMR